MGKESKMKEIEEDNLNEIIDEEIRKKEIKCIKNIKRKITLKIIISVLITCVLFIIGLYLWNTYRFIQDENGKWILYNFNTGNIKQGKDYTHIIMEYKAYKVKLEKINLMEDSADTEEKEMVEHQVLLTFNKEDICINAREIISGYAEDELEDVYEWYVNGWKNNVTSNEKIENGKLYMNDNTYVGKTKEQLIKNSKSYNAQLTEV